MIKLHLTIFGAALALLSLAPPARAAPLKVAIDSCPTATVTGLVGDYPSFHSAPGSMREFLGIPYAEPPTGSNRWRPPKPHCWKGNRPAIAFGNICPQHGTAGGDEDCLFLNVFTPPTGNYSDLPVMVLMNRGSFISSSGSDWAQNPVDLVKQGVVVVTFNHRLGALGFLAHSALDNRATKQTGNYHILDQQAALRWVKANIAGFGGDPKNVTIFGQSTGGVSVLVHLVSPLSRGLFHKAIIESGGLYQKPTLLAKAQREGAQFAAKVGCGSGTAAQKAACLRKLPVRTILANQNIFLGGDPTMLRQDGVVLPDSIRNLLRAGRFHKVPIINGSNRDDHRRISEVTYIGTGDLCKFTSNLVPNGQDTFPGAVSYRKALQIAFGYAPKLPELVEKAYPAGRTAFSANIAFWDAQTDATRACRSLRLHNWIAQNGGEIFAYEFNDRDAPVFATGPVTLRNGTDFPARAYLRAETQYLFPMPPTVGCLRRYPGLSRNQKTLATAMVTYWTTFAKTGDPNPLRGISPPDWPRYTLAEGKMLSLLSPTPRIMTAATFDTAHKCSAFWNDRNQ